MVDVKNLNLVNVISCVYLYSW